MKHKRLMFNVLERKVLGRALGKAKQQTGLTDRTTGGRLLPFICGWLAQDPQEVEMIDLR